MSLTEIKKSPVISLPFLKKRLRRITALGLRNLTINDLSFTVHFTLHRNDKTVAFYTSESVENQRSPEWSYLQFPAHVQFLQDFVIRAWITSLNACRLFLEYDVHLDDSLMPDEQKDESSRSNNSFWLEMFGYRFTDNESIINNQKNIQLIDIRPRLTEKKSKRNYSVKSYNRSSVIRMIGTIEAIRTTNRLSTECLDSLQTLVKTNEDYLSKIKERESRKVRVDNLKQHFFVQVSNNQRRLNSNQDRQKAINEKKNRLDENLFQLLQQQEELNLRIDQLNQSKCLLHDLNHLVTFRQKELVSEIYRHVYPITAESKTEFSIGNIKLPPAEDRSYLLISTREREYEIEAALGYCAHIVLIVSQFLQLPLRFPIDCYGAPSIRIYDFTQQKPDFPLCPSYDTRSFAYGLYLLNRDIGQIMIHCRMCHRRPNYRNTLENLKELMEHYFLDTKNKPQIQLLALNQQSIESTTLSNNSINDRPLMRNKRHSIANSMFSPSRSEISSAIEITDDDHNEDDTHEVNLFPTLNPISPRLTMQFSQQH